MEVHELEKIIKDVQQKNPALTQFGFGGEGDIRPHAVDLCIQWLFIVDGLERRKTINENQNSYGLKHDVERYFSKYIANGEFICAALYLGYKMKVRGPNAWFNIKQVQRKN
tara:strand:+ start:1568 stop:1900 length:333 start_codon:yes stop_codon:yes gene_type:complete